jgi:hypothetical protein
MNQVLGMVYFTIDDGNSYPGSTVGKATGLKRVFWRIHGFDYSFHWGVEITGD